MAVTLQPSLFDDGDLGVSFADLEGSVRHHPLTAGAWVDHRPTWLDGSQVVFDNLVTGVPWRSERRQMYDRVVDVPRLVRFYAENEPLPDPALVDAREALSTYYFDRLGEPFATSGLCFYRDGSDSVAWHGDDTGRSRTEDTMVAILSLGAARSLLLRPRGGGQSLRFNLGHGDLLVMGGSCQRTWEHCVPKSARSPGPRISVQFRTRGVR